MEAKEALDFLGNIRVDQAEDKELINNYINLICEYNMCLLENMIERLKNKGHWGKRKAKSLENYTDTELFNAYLPKVFSPHLPQDNSQETINKAIILFRMSYNKFNEIIPYVRSIPEGEVWGLEKTDPNYVMKRQFYKYLRIVEWVNSAENAQNDIERFYNFILKRMNVETSKWFFKSSQNAFDFPSYAKNIILGFPISKLGIINQGLNSSSTVVAAGCIRSYLESVLFGFSFKSKTNKVVRFNTTNWEKALEFRKKNKHITNDEERIIRGIYTKLCGSVHAASYITAAEALYMLDKVREIEQAITSREESKSTIPEEPIRFNKIKDYHLFILSLSLTIVLMVVLLIWSKSSLLNIFVLIPGFLTGVFFDKYHSKKTVLKRP